MTRVGIALTIAALPAALLAQGSVLVTAPGNPILADGRDYFDRPCTACRR